ncbi:MAG: hypothetical protein J6T25_00305 [Bacilli bacterium]|nr:hypothetical protein [Bacilli bacterium]
MKRHLRLLPILGIVSIILSSCGHGTKSSSVASSSSSSESSFSSSSESSTSIAPKTYTVTWKNSDGAVLETDYEVVEGTTPTFDGDEPRKDSDAQYNYVFSEWVPAIGPVNADIEYVASYHEELRKYTVIWKDEDGTVLETDNNVPYGTTPEYNEDEPTKEMTKENVYSFKDWEPKVDKVEGDIVYTATYQEDVRKYIVTWKNEDESVIKEDEVPYGTLPQYEGQDPSKESTVDKVYTFDGWSPNIKEVEGDATYVATFKEETRSYKVTWLNDDGSTLRVDDVFYGETPSYGEENPTKENRRGVTYYFAGWSPEIVPVESDQTYTAEYTYEATFLFDRMHYELEDGYQESDLLGAPWVNVNAKGQIDKIKQPSLKDDFYASINYDNIKNRIPGPFDISKNNVSEAISSIFDGTSETTNGAVANKAHNKILNGDVENITTSLNNIDVTSYLTSKDLFLSSSSLLQLVTSEDAESGYEIVVNDGYTGGNTGLHTLFFFAKYYSEYAGFANNIANKLKEVYGLNTSSSDVNNVREFEAKIADYNYQAYYTSGTGLETYVIDELPWSNVKSALLDLGFTSNDSISIKKYFANAMNYIFNDSSSSKKAIIKNAVKYRLAFDYRCYMGLDNYRSIYSSIEGSGLFNNERNLGGLEDERLARNLVSVCMPLVLEQSYLELDSSEETKAQVASIIESVLNGYKEILNDSEWMTKNSKNKVINKLNKMKYESCYPDEYLHFAKLDQSNIESASAVELNAIYNKGVVNSAIAGELNNSPLWGYMSTYTINAFYTAGYNSFVILNGLVSGFLSESIEETYAGIGFVIGHEITHGFDSNGANYDAEGKNNPVMTVVDRKTFGQKVDKMIAFYNQINLYDGAMVNGNNVNGEATADMGGMKVMLKLAESIPDFDYDLFFRSYAKTWMEMPYDISYLPARAENEHPFEYLRANVTLAQFDKFYETYDIGPGDGMYIPENQRVAIW